MDKLVQLSLTAQRRKKKARWERLF
jgi:hypothetical protein